MSSLVTKNICVIVLQISGSDDSNITESDEGNDNVLNRCDENEYSDSLESESSDSSASEEISLDNILIPSDNFCEQSGSELDDSIYDNFNGEQIGYNELNDQDIQVCIKTHCLFFNAIILYNYGSTWSLRERTPLKA